MAREPVKVKPKPKKLPPGQPSLGQYVARADTAPRVPGTSKFLGGYTFYAAGAGIRAPVPPGFANQPKETRGSLMQFAQPTLKSEFSGGIRAEAMRGLSPYEQKWAEYSMNASGIMGRPLYTETGATAMSIYTMDPNKRMQVKAKLHAAGYEGISNNPYVDKATEDAWTSLLKFANSLGVTWEMAAGMRAGQGYAAETAAKGGGGGGGAKSQARTWTTVSTDAILSGRDEAFKVLNAAAQALLGRDARDGDIDPFLARLQGAQRASPRKTTTTQSTNAEGLLVSSASTVEESNVLPDVQAQGEVKNVDENEMKAYRRLGYTQVMERLFGGRAEMAKTFADFGYTQAFVSMYPELKPLLDQAAQ